jgi:hypothetical protein
MTLGTLLDLQDALKDIKTSVPLVITLYPDGSVDTVDLRSYLTEQLREELEEEIRDELYDEVRDALYNEIYDEVKADLKRELTTDTQTL